MTSRRTETGFTLIEISIVLLIVAIILGYTVALFPIQQELKQYRQAEQEMEEIIDALYAYAQVEGHLPCPAWFDNSGAPAPPVTSDGFECRDDGAPLDCGGDDPTTQSCDVWYGFVPGKTLGINGNYSARGLLLDPWSQPYRYQVTDVDQNGPGTNLADFVITGELDAEVTVAGNLTPLNPDLYVCNVDPSAGTQGADVNCGGVGSEQNIVVNDVPVVIHSTGKNTEGNVATTSWIQRENLDNSAADVVFVSTVRSDIDGAEFDDLVRWISPNILYSKMIESGQLLN